MKTLALAIAAMFLSANTVATGQSYTVYDHPIYVSYTMFCTKDGDADWRCIQQPVAIYRTEYQCSEYEWRRVRALAEALQADNRRLAADVRCIVQYDA